jgi:type VI protein secretion system component Hcp
MEPRKFSRSSAPASGFRPERRREGNALVAVSGGKLIDKAPPKLYEACCKGTHIPQVAIS